MAGLALTAEPLTVLLLTEKWLPAVPYMRICCITYALHPIVSAHLQAIAAIGRSDVRLKLEFIKKPVGILLLILSVPYGPFAIAVSAALTGVVSFLVNVITSRIYVRLSIKEQVKDLLLPVVLTLLMSVVVFIAGKLPLIPILKIIIQVLSGAVVYVLFSALFKPEGYRYLINLIAGKFPRFSKR